MQKCRRFYGTKAIKPKNIDTTFAGGNDNVAECSRNYRYSYIHTKK